MEKNFLESINNDYPSSFAEEKFVENKKSKKGIIITCIVSLLLIVLVLIIYLGLNKKITMKNFVGESRETLNIWLKENDINNKNVVISYAYDSEYDENYIINQNILEGEKFSKNKILTFTISKGADPDELVDFPDIKNLNNEEIRKWITDNKLTNVKITQEYNDEILKDFVISYKLRNIEEKDFTRSSNLSIIVSKGPKPKNEIVMENFIGKSSEEIASWANLNKINLAVTPVFSSKEAGTVTYQSVLEGTKIEEGQTISINISKGEGVTIPYLVSKSKNEVEAWANASGILLSINEVYSNIPKNKVIAQNIAANNLIGVGESIVVTVSLGQPYLENYKGENISELLEWVDDVNSKGCSISVSINDKAYYSDSVKKDGIINQSKNGYLALNDSIKVTLSLGSKILIDTNYIGMKEEDIKAFCAELNCLYEYKKDKKDIGTILDIKVNDKTLKPDMYIDSSDVILVTISEGE